MIINLFLFKNIGSTENISKHKLSGIIEWNFEKRPFCNAFTGCGRKRTFISQAKIEDAEALSGLIDMNAEPAVANVQRQIMSQAKLFEALKEGTKEILMQNNKDKLNELQTD
ncbi:cardioactive peptide [Episyrphus balteatus]|uniref:cardioactive peptide n=1 Tax=Episyrphus balteatus TaxID=286459 RepID=UPI002485AB65|nr:cardioactive peptide [Episyrphus balteatus]